MDLLTTRYRHLPIAVLFLLCTVLFFNAAPGIAQEEARSFRWWSDYLYITDFETTHYDEIIWFWTPDSLDGPLHSNEAFGVKYNPSFFGTVTTSADDFYEYAANPFFAYEPEFRWPEASFPEEAATVRGAAAMQGRFLSEEGLQYRAHATIDSLYWWAWTDELPWDSTLVVLVDVAAYHDSMAIFFDGDLQLFGEGLSGTGMIGAAGDIYLMDNLVYEDVPLEGEDAYRVPPDSPHRWGVMSEGSILVANTWANGRGNGANRTDGDPDSSSIAITVALSSLSESFTFHQQNETWDEYRFCDPQGPHPGGPDERGTIYLHGSMMQKRRGYTHRSNCGGTGYFKSYSYDERLQGSPPPFLPEIDWEHAVGGEVVWSDTMVQFDNENPLQIIGRGSVTLGPGAQIVQTCSPRDPQESKPPFRLRMGGRLAVDGTAGSPAQVDYVAEPEYDEPFPALFVEEDTDAWETGSLIDSTWEYLEVDGSEAEWFDFIMPKLLRHGRLTGNPRLVWDEDRTELPDADSCVFEGDVHMWSQPLGTLSRSIVYGRLANPFEVVDHCVIVTAPGDSAAAMINSRSNATMQNSFIYAPGRYVIEAVLPLTMEYSGYYYDDSFDPFLGATLTIGEGVLEDVDPLFVDALGGDVSLQAGSPLIDAGDPAAPLDPDGTRADIGVHFFDQNESDPGDAHEALPTAFQLTGPYPNPFNASTVVRVHLPVRSDLEVHVVDVLGREAGLVGRQILQAGVHTVKVDLSTHASGVYFIHVKANEYTLTARAVLVK
ncbi:DUF4900 domain-containing protein [bacterium]|nr:DUF4900 domain-containing protein [bacterium]